ncbi:Aste57867_11809 [Aphanomyces stellatus]|uniref:Oxidation resistance protein 1 n=1 Tax=Aphanomyces stellatus TaxID=120398 RepID=A0A485KU12_9STRA|nr:hypothetical protein As57867_011764 [Aphanomyces stellatus]VFT88664.1 Aste57867_11809 [Aphanomyces stellatus]
MQVGQRPTPSGRTGHRASLPTVERGNNSPDTSSSTSQGPRIVYVVQDGDTIAGIALKHGMRESDVRHMNHLFGGNIYKGQELVLRVKLRSHSVPTNAPAVNVPPPPTAVRRQSVTKTIEKAHDALSGGGIEATSSNNQHDEPSSPTTSPLASTPFPPTSSSSSSNKQPGPTTTHQPEMEPAAPGGATAASTKKPLVEVTSIPKLRNATSMDILPDPSFSKFLVPKLEACLPPQYRGYDWSIAYSLAQHGASLDTLYRNVRGKRASLVVVETGDGDIFGAFASSAWTPSSQSFYGTGECFVFTCYPKFEHFGWKGQDAMLMFSNESMLAMGGGGGFAWALNADLSRGTSTRSLTFGNRCLTRRSEFDVVNCEVWEFVPKV